MWHLSDYLGVLQLIATTALIVVAAFQAKAAAAQARAATDEVATSIRPRIAPRELQPVENGCNLSLTNSGHGTAYYLRWKFHNESNWTLEEEVLPVGGFCEVRIRNNNWKRALVVEYWSGHKKKNTTKIDLNSAGLDHVYRDEISDEVLLDIKKLAGS